MSSEEIYEDLCNKIEMLEYMPGEKLSENELAALYGVSRHIIRGALASLKNRRLVEVYPQRGTFVSLIDTDYISDILYMRESVEQEAVTRIIENGRTEEIVDRMRLIVQAQRDLKEGESYAREFYELDNMFHQVLLSAVGHSNVMNLIAEPYIHIRRWRNYEVRSVSRMKEIVEEHAKIVDALAKKDATLSRTILHQHLDTANRYSKPLKAAEAQYFA